MNVTIEKIEIVSFGKLKNVSITPSSGINILSAPNESGKSTLAAFIKFVFYGFVGARMQTLTDNEKKLYTPWDSEVSYGGITITANGTKYDIVRKCLPSGKETVDIVNRVSGKNEFVGEVPGEVFFGVGEDVFARTLFFRQLTTPQSKDDILADRLRNIAIGADEQVGTKKAISRLNESKNELKGKLGSGLLPKAERERDAFEEAITEATDIRKEVVRLHTEINNRAEKIEIGEKRLEALEKERKNIEKYDSLLRLQNIERLTSEAGEAKRAYESEKRRIGANDEIDLSPISAKNTEYIAESIKLESVEKAYLNVQNELNEARQSEGLENKAETSLSKSGIALVCIALAALAAGVWLFSAGNTAAFVACAAVGVLTAAFGIVAIAKVNKANAESKKAYQAELFANEQYRKAIETRVENARAEYEASCERLEVLKAELKNELDNYTDVSESDDYSSAIDELRRISLEIEKKRIIAETKENELKNTLSGVDIEALAESARGAVKPERDRNAVEREIKFYGQQQDQLIALTRRDELDCAALEAKCGDVATLVGKRDALSVRAEELAVKHKAYETAVKYIEAAADHMKSMVAPRIGKRADEYFTIATGGKYKALEVDTKLSMSVGEDFRRSCDYLSAGTRDSAYLSLRLALADMLYGGCSVSMILDDAFVRMDDERLSMISHALDEAAKKHQIFILTHGEREKSALNNAGIAYNEISLSQ